MRRLAFLAFLLLFGAAVSAEAPQAVDTGVEQGPQLPTKEEGNATVGAPADWDDANPWGGSPPWTWYGDPESVDCRAVPSWCLKAAEAGATLGAVEGAVLD